MITPFVYDHAFWLQSRLLFMITPSKLVWVSLGKLGRVWGKAPNEAADVLVHFGTGKSYIF